MKKVYIAPVMEREVFETKDVITVSVIFNTTLAQDNDTGITTVDRSEFEFN